ncbi:MAG: hypothetical protein K2H14_08055 [Muribaculaceae bacterium]|nr:hypothetical protein [Muribaculaceae bacterium]
MKHIFSLVIFAVTAVTAFCRLPEGWGDRVLPIDGVPIDKVCMDPGAVWEFGWTGDKPQQAGYKIYGDTLLCEIADGRREWYAIGGDTARWFREETALMRLVTDEGYEAIYYDSHGRECQRVGTGYNAGHHSDDLQPPRTAGMDLLRRRPCHTRHLRRSGKAYGNHALHHGDSGVR